MQTIFGKRTLRELRKNFLRYFALLLLIILGMFMIVGMIGAAENIISAVEGGQQRTRVEDGQFSLFVPLEKAEVRDLEKDGITLESMFYLDYRLSDASTVRVFANRENINKIDLSEGCLAEKKGQIVLEKNYANAKKISVGDSITIGGESFAVTGLATTPDYDAVYKELTDASADARQFGTAFVSRSQYTELKKQGKASKSEEYIYSYLLNGKMTQDELKERLQDLDLDEDKVKDPYFKEMMEDLEATKDKISKGVSKVQEGAAELKDGLQELDSYSAEVNDGAEQIFSSSLDSISGQLAAHGIKEKLTEGNYQSVLKNLIAATDQNPQGAQMKVELKAALKSLKALQQYKTAMVEYTGGVGSAEEGAGSLSKGTDKLKDKTDELLEEYFTVDIDNLTQLLEREDNPRIGASIDDVMINKYAGFVAGVILMILFTFVISVFVIHNIDQEGEIIGTLYALGVKKRQLLLHYLLLPVLITFVGGVIGVLLGLGPGAESMQADSVIYFSMPQLASTHPLYLLLYGLVMPPLVAAVVNFAVINKKLSRPALQLIRGEKKQTRMSHVKLTRMGYVKNFQIRQFLREVRPNITVVCGMFISLLILMIGVNCYGLCKNLIVNNQGDTTFEHMYSLKYAPEKVPEGGEACYLESLKKTAFGYDLDVSLLGIDEDNPYFDFQVEKGKNSVVLSEAAASKFELKVGDELVLSDEEDQQDYAFKVDRIEPYSLGMYVFMDMDSMQELFGQEEDYYNVLYSDQALDIDAGRLYASVSKEDILQSSEVFFNMMKAMVSMMISVSALIFIVVMYLMMKAMIDRSSYNISLMKVFGYRKREIKRLYLNGNFLLIVISAAICIPLAKLVINALYPYFVSNVAVGIDLTLGWQIYGMIYVGIIFCYFLINRLLVRRVSRMNLQEVLKTRE